LEYFRMQVTSRQVSIWTSQLLPMPDPPETTSFILSADVVVAVGNGGCGTLSKVGLTIEAGKPLALYQTSNVFNELVKSTDVKQLSTSDVSELMEWIEKFIDWEG